MRFLCLSLALVMLAVSVTSFGINDLRATRLEAVHRWTDKRFGQIAGLSTDNDGDLHIFHRAMVTWRADTFGPKDKCYLKRAIPKPTVMKVNPKTGKISERWGNGLFYLPHGLTIDHDDNFWMTDVCLHQVFKFDKDHKKILELGEARVPGTDETHFCKPTDVAVAGNGVFFVSDGYCNSRIVKFNPDGSFNYTWGRDADDDTRPKPAEFLIPHSLALIEERDLLCVADREHGRIQCFKAGLEDPSETGDFVFGVPSPNDGIDIGKVFAIAYDSEAKLLYAVNGRSPMVYEVQGLTIDLDRRQIIDTWEPSQGETPFYTPHDLATDSRGSVYVGEIGPNVVWQFRYGGKK